MDAEHHPSADNLPEYESKISDEAIDNLVVGASNAIKRLSTTLQAIEAVADNHTPGTSFEIDSDSLSPLFNNVEHAKGVLFALDSLVPIKDGTSWQDIAEGLADQPE